MNRRGFLAALLVAPIAVKAATLLPAPKATTPLRRVAGTLVEYGPIHETSRTQYYGNGGPVSRTFSYTRSYVVSADGGRIVNVYRDGERVFPDGDVLTISGGMLYADKEDVTDRQGSIPAYEFDVA